MTPAKAVWVFRIVHQDTGKPAQGVPVTVLDESGDPAGYWVSEADGTLAIPRRPGPRLRLRVGLRNEEPMELATASLGDEPVDLAAPSFVPAGSLAERPERPTVPPGEPVEVPAHVLYFQRLALFADRATAVGAGSDNVADFFVPAPEPAAVMRYGVVVEIEELWASLGVQWGELLYSVSLTPGDEARLAVLDGRWRRDVEGRERPLQILARMVGTSMLGDLVTALRPELQLEPFSVSTPDLAAAAADSVGLIRERTERMSQALRRRPLGVVDVNAEPAPGGAIRTVRNTTADRVVTFHFFEPLERFRVVVRTPRLRPVLFVPFRLPNVATPDVIRRFGYIFRRTLLDRAMVPLLDLLLSGENADARVSRLIEHVEANLLYYSTAILAAGDPGARLLTLAKMRAPNGVPLTDVIENTVAGRVGNAVAFPLRTMELLPAAWREALAAYEARPPRITEEFAVTIPHPGVWVAAQPHEPMQRVEAQSAAG
ncbi:MAG TPA: hypothetical protein VN848_10400 [Gemmatimonadales bacterium]|nr:hypothetical protein [Gemmatimonadales bacterium]